MTFNLTQVKGALRTIGSIAAIVIGTINPGGHLPTDVATILVGSGGLLITLTHLVEKFVGQAKADIVSAIEKDVQIPGTVGGK